MYRATKAKSTSLRVNKSYQGERIEEKVQRITSNKEPIKDGAPLVFTERKDGVMAAYNPRTDRFEVAIDAMNVVTKSHQAKRQERADARLKALEGGNKDSGAESIVSTGTDK